MSEKRVFAPNLVFAYKQEPAQGGFFMLSPERGDWETHLKLHFMNSTIGFGKELTNRGAAGSHRIYTEWNWHGANIDQG